MIIPYGNLCINLIKKYAGSCINYSLHVTKRLNLGLTYEDYVRGGADKYSARPTSRYRRAELLVSLERGVCSCAELQVVSCYRG